MSTVKSHEPQKLTDKDIEASALQLTQLQDMIKNLSDGEINELLGELRKTAFEDGYSRGQVRGYETGREGGFNDGVTKGEENITKGVKPIIDLLKQSNKNLKEQNRTIYDLNQTTIRELLKFIIEFKKIISSQMQTFESPVKAKKSSTAATSDVTISTPDQTKKLVDMFELGSDIKRGLGYESSHEKDNDSQKVYTDRLELDSNPDNNALDYTAQSFSSPIAFISNPGQTTVKKGKNTIIGNEQLDGSGKNSQNNSFKIEQEPVPINLDTASIDDLFALAQASVEKKPRNKNFQLNTLQVDGDPLGGLIRSIDPYGSGNNSQNNSFKSSSVNDESDKNKKKYEVRGPHTQNFVNNENKPQRKIFTTCIQC